MKKFEEITVTHANVACDGGGGALGHPKIYLQIEKGRGSIVCPYCSRSYVLAAGAKKSAAH